MLPPLTSQDNNFAQDLDEYTYDDANQDDHEVRTPLSNVLFVFYKH